MHPIMISIAFDEIAIRAAIRWPYSGTADIEDDRSVGPVVLAFHFTRADGGKPDTMRANDHPVLFQLLAEALLIQAEVEIGELIEAEYDNLGMARREEIDQHDPFWDRRTAGNVRALPPYPYLRWRF